MTMMMMMNCLLTTRVVYNFGRFCMYVSLSVRR